MKIPQQLLAPIVGVLAGCFGIGVGLIIRQPEINEAAPGRSLNSKESRRA